MDVYHPCQNNKSSIILVSVDDQTTDRLPVTSFALNSHTDLPFHALFSNALKSQPCCHVRLLGIHRQVLAECEPLAAKPVEAPAQGAGSRAPLRLHRDAREVGLRYRCRADIRLPHSSAKHGGQHHVAQERSRLQCHQAAQYKSAVRARMRPDIGARCRHLRYHGRGLLKNEDPTGAFLERKRPACATWGWV